MKIDSRWKMELYKYFTENGISVASPEEIIRFIESISMPDSGNQNRSNLKKFIETNQEIPLNYCAIGKFLNMKQQTVKYHLGVLSDNGDIEINEDDKIIKIKEA